MSEKIKKTLQQRREENYLALVSMLEKCVSSEVKQTLIDFLEYCKENKINFSNANPINYNNWNMGFKGKGKGMGALRFRFTDGHTTLNEKNYCYIDVTLDLRNSEIENFVINENLTEVVWKNVKRCEGCLSTCSPGKDMTLFGKTLNNICGYNADKFLRFRNPNAESLYYIKKIMEFRKELLFAEKV